MGSGLRLVRRKRCKKIHKSLKPTWAKRLAKMAGPLLSVQDLQVRYGAIQALKGLSFAVDAREIVTLIGANGAGKTTTLRAITGLTPAQGRVLLDGVSLLGQPVHSIVASGVAHAPEGRGIFPNLTVRENLLLGAYRIRNPAQIEEGLTRAFTRFPILK